MPNRLAIPPAALVRLGLAVALLVAMVPGVALAAPTEDGSQVSAVAKGARSAAALAPLPNRVLVRFDESVPGWRRSAQAVLAGARVDEERPGLAKLGWTILEPQAGTSPIDVFTRIAATGTATDVSFDAVATPALSPNDPMYSQLWGLNNTGQSVNGSTGTAGADIGAVEAWGTETGSSDTIVAIVDTGIDFSHPDLAGNAWLNPLEIAGNGIDDDVNGLVDDVNGWDYYNNDNTLFDGSPEDNHATHVAGTIGAVGNNNYGVTGINWDVQIMSLKFIGPTTGDAADAAEAIVYAVDHGANVINHSWTSPASLPVLDSALQYAADHGVLNVAAAGNYDRLNNDNEPMYPASSDATNVIAVAATDSRDQLASFSDVGPESVDLGAPGVNIMSTVPGPLYSYYNGTSMASPHVTGSIALLHSAYPTENAAQLRARLENALEPIGALSGWTASGGRLDLATAMGGYPRPDIVSPTYAAVLDGSTPGTITFAPRYGTAPGATFEAQLGMPTEAIASGGFESGNLAGWTTGGNTPSFYVSSSAPYVRSGTYGVRSGAIAHSQYSQISRSVTLSSAGELSFWYWYDAEDGYDYGYVTIDGDDAWHAATDTGWTRVTLPLSGGTHTIAFGYAKDTSVSQGLDAVGYDDIRATAYSWIDADIVSGAYEATFRVPGTVTDNAAVRARAVVGAQDSAWASQSGLVIDSDTVAPGPVTALAASRSGDDVALTWTNPADADFDVTRVVSRLGTPPSGPDDPAAELVYEGAASGATDWGVFDGSIEGEQYYAAYPYDTSGNRGGGASTSITVDVNGPYGTFSLDGGAVYATSTSVSADSAMSDVVEMAFDVAGFPAGTWEPYAAQRSLTLAGEGVQGVVARYRDDASNVATRSDTIMVDTIAPTASATGAPAEGVWSTTPVSMTLSGGDSGSGLASLHYRLNGATPVTYTGAVPMPQGVNTFEYWAQDKAGNTSVPVSITVRVDTIAPAAPAGLVITGAGMGWLNVAWDSLPATDVVSYALYRSQPASGARSLVATFAADASLKRLDSGLVDDAQYGYVVTATDDHGNEGVVSAQAVGRPGVALAPAAGSTRYSTAMIAALSGFDTAPVVVLATGEDYADALGASALAGAYDAPVLLTKRTALPGGLLDTLSTLKTTRVIIVGGTAAVSSAVETQLNGVFGASKVDRIDGADRYATAAAVASATLTARGSDVTTEAVFVVRGNGFADALAVAPVAYGASAPILLVKPTSTPQATRDAIASGGYSRAIVVGGSTAVSDAVAGGLGIPWTRVDGSTRYVTAEKFAAWAAGEGLATYATCGLATGEDFPDALGGGAVVGHDGGVLLLTKRASLSASAEAAIASNASTISKLRVFGGDAAISPATRSAAYALVGR